MLYKCNHAGCQNDRCNHFKEHPAEKLCLTETNCPWLRREVHCLPIQTHQKPPQTLVDEVSGVTVPNADYRIWQAGYNARTQEVEKLMSELRDRANELDQAMKYLREK